MKNYTYEIVARTFPAFLSVLPFLVLYYFFLSVITPDFLKFILGVRFDYISLIVVLTYLMIQICRLIGKFIFQNKYFKGEDDFPTTVFLLKNDGQYSQQFKDKMRNKIMADFNVDIYADDNQEATKKRISEAVSLIRNKVKDGRFILKHNIEYGFWRNFIGGSMIAVITSVFNSLFFYFYSFNKPAFFISFIFLLLYLIPLLFSKIIIVNLGKNYAKILFQEYLA